ncbi:nucleolar protein NOP52 variant [Polychaeton citri CBS 116435]|uniref:Nucleolar protein NOP52 variant n=1 Tax=Polychaeton citri CBS 116435 TaxID=1314669 RepID=A0A9P4Q3J3_9PEZI|nr:nucleolar protein NOP52 variant [Polychaeton citri CBS 116435]
MAVIKGASTTPSFVKSLVSSDRSIRDRALTSLRTYLSRTTQLSPAECMKLWKGLFFSMWHSDKPRNQQRLARDLADLVDVLREDKNILDFTDAFYKTMAAQWNGIDALRMDKYLYLIRCFVNKGFVVCMKAHKEERPDFIDAFTEMLELTAANAKDATIPNGLRYHVIDVYVDELEKVDADHEGPVDVLMKPMKDLVKNSKNKVSRERAQAALDDERLEEWNPDARGKGKDSESENDECDFDGFGD